ncbi:hypothetical protein [Desulfogranum mediterraneum]|uniref:hypothetical protein n=1 Tax=Desulfogranum mediterraneum TaxID=160661 RepID=UPI0003FDB03B|nr:hypothetical protein [Desulfogranum mediterraneum]
MFQQQAKSIVPLLTLVALIALAAPVLAVDYGSMSTEELHRLRGSLRQAPAQQQEAFRAAWQERVRTMTPQEQSRYLGPANRPAAVGKKGPGQGQGRGQGRGQGQGAKRSGQRP